MTSTPVTPASITILIEPEPGGHRFQAVANVAAVAGRTDQVLLLTSRGAASSPEFGVYLDGMPIQVDERFDAIHPSTREIASAVAQLARDHDVSTVVLMDADRSLKRWFYVAWSEFRGLGDRMPRIVFMLTRYPARLRLTDRVGMKLRISKGILSAIAIANGTIHHVAGFAGRDDMSPGWIVKRTRDPAICSAHHDDRDALRQELGLPVDRRLVGIFGVIEERKNAPLILEALEIAGLDDVDLLLAGGIQEPVQAWIDELSPERRTRVLTCSGFLTNEMLDKNVAAVDAVPIALTNNGPSGIMGKALAAGVPVVTAGSRVRAQELKATDAGVATEWSAAALGAGIREVLERDPDSPRRNTVPPATATEFSLNLLGIDASGQVRGRTPRRSGRRSR